MATFLEAEKQRLIPFKTTSPYFSEAAKADGVYRGKPRPFCLPRQYAEENLFSGIRHSVMAYFADQEIKWHDGRDGKPSNHLCDSQVCCANFLFPLADQPEALAALLRPVYPSIQWVLPMEQAGQYVSMEWIGHNNYLEESRQTRRRRTRGANFTSADAAVRFEDKDGSRQIVLIEWKYTESYSSTSLVRSRSGTDRTKIYRKLYKQSDFPLDKSKLPGFDALFYEPFYQFMRQQMLANEMEKAKELWVDKVSLLHIAPAHNSNFQRVTSPDLRVLGKSVIEVWKYLQTRSDRFASVSVEELFGHFPINRFPQMIPWWEYIHTRYPWVRNVE